MCMHSISNILLPSGVEARRQWKNAPYLLVELSMNSTQNLIQLLIFSPPKVPKCWQNSIMGCRPKRSGCIVSFCSIYLGSSNCPGLLLMCCRMQSCRLGSIFLFLNRIFSWNTGECRIPQESSGSCRKMKKCSCFWGWKMVPFLTPEYRWLSFLAFTKLAKYLQSNTFFRQK